MMIDRTRLVFATTFAVAMQMVGPAASAGDWTQVYIGAGLGADVINGQGQVQSNTGEVLSGEAPIGGDLGLSITAGADYQFSRHIVGGVFATYDWSNIDTNASISDGVDTVRANLIKVDQAWTVGARLGFLATDATLIYGLLGYSWLEFDDLSVSGAGLNLAFALPDTRGWTIGGGFEHKLNQNVSLRGEYRYTDFGQEALRVDPAIGAIAGESQSHSARLVAAYRFGGTNEAETEAASPAPARNWSGAYLGAGFGVDAFVRDIDVTVPQLGLNAQLNGLGGGGFAGTVIAGYDHMISPSLVVGVFGDYSAARSEFTVSASVGGDSASAELLSLDSQWTIGGRAGVVLGDDVLAYGLMGYTRVDLNDVSLSGGGQGVVLNFPNLDGVTFGGGFEKTINEWLSLRAEYRYTALSDASVPIIANVADMTIDPSMHSAKLLATIRFPGGSPLTK